MSLEIWWSVGSSSSKIESSAVKIEVSQLPECIFSLLLACVSSWEEDLFSTSVLYKKFNYCTSSIFIQ